MRTILSADARGTLDNLAARHALLAFDFDGTLAPIVSDRRAASIRPDTRRLLRALSLMYPCAVISGRARADVAARLDGIPLVGVVGNHGAEAGRGPVDRTLRPRVQEWIRRLKSDLSLVPGIDIEDKWFSVAVHYRAVPSRAAGRCLAVRAASALEDARIVGGHAVVNVVPREAPDKAAALATLLQRVGHRPALYVGDDRTDEHAFAAPCVDVAVRVGRTARSAAPWYVSAQAEVDELLRGLIAARTRRDGLGDRWEGVVNAVKA
jgi:trehalose 6-phosphate phosphatase